MTQKSKSLKKINLERSVKFYTTLGLIGAVIGLEIFGWNAVAKTTDSQKGVNSKINLDSKKLYEGSWVPEKRDFPIGTNPCENFYQYTCGPLVEQFQLREDRSYHAFAFSDSRERMLQARKNYLQILVEPDSDNKYQLNGRFSGSMKTLFKACMNTESRKSEEQKKLQFYKSKIENLKTTKDIKEFIANDIFAPTFTMMGYSDIENQKNPAIKDLMFMTSFNFITEKSYYEKPEFVQDLTALYSDFFKVLGFSNTEQKAKDLIEIEKDFINHYPERSARRDRFAENNLIKTDQFIKKYPELPFAKILTKFPSKVSIRNPLPEGLENLNRYLQQPEKLETLKSLLLARNIMGFMDDAYPEFYEKVFSFKRKHLGGPEKRPDRLERCTKLVENQFGKEIDYELLPVLFKDFPENRIRQLSEQVRNSLKMQIEKNQWLSKSAKTEALQKVQTAELMVFKPLNDKEWDFAPQAALNENTPLENNENLEKAKIKKELKEFPEPRYRRKWYMGPLEINAYYNPTDNQFVLPAGILQYPFFDKSMTDEQILGGIGSVIGHELGHGIDDQGSKFDHKGRLQQWMTEQDLQSFKSRTQGFVNRFNNIKHDGKLTLGENIGDSVGIRSSFLAAFGADENKWDSEKLKSFFIQYGRNWCFKARPSLLEMMLKTDPHSAGDARTNEQVIHLQGFYKAFQCTAKDKMFIPESDRIQVW